MCGQFSLNTASFLLIHKTHDVYYNDPKTPIQEGINPVGKLKPLVIPLINYAQNCFHPSIEGAQHGGFVCLRVGTHPLQRILLHVKGDLTMGENIADLGGAQCGYCTPGILMTAKALLEKDPNPSREKIKEAISGNLCRCTGYQQIYESIEEAARTMQQESER